MKRKSIDVKKSTTSSRKPAGAALRQASLTQALYRALFEEWAETGYASLRMERIAARAGVGKATLYRRWKTRLDLAQEAVENMALSVTPVPDTGSLQGDLRATIRSFMVALRHPLIRRILPDLHAENARSTELNGLLDRVTRARRAQASAVFARAVDRGELPRGIDERLALSMLVAPLYWMVIAQGRRPDPSDMEQIAEIAHLSILHAAGRTRDAPAGAQD